MVNCNPETVSTDYDTSTRLYFEPLTLEDVLAVVEAEQPRGVIVQFGGQTPLKLAAPLERRPACKLLGTSVDAIDLAEDRRRFGELLDRLGYKAPPYAVAAERRGRGRGGARRWASRCSRGRPTCSAGGRWRSSTRADDLSAYLARSGAAYAGREIFLDRFLERAVEVDVDALCDGETAWIGGIMQHVEEAGVHSGDSACVLPPHSIGGRRCSTASARSVTGIALELGVVGLINVQLAVTSATTST